MSVNPSPIGGFAAQFFDNNGNPLSGGKIYTYVAGTTTPQATYTNAFGTTPHANPIVLDSAGRVPGGEIWLTDSLIYKFVIETSTSILIGTYDNITGVNSNFVNYTVQEEVITATAGQTVFNLTSINYAPGTNSLSVYIDGVNQYVGDSYLETDSNTVTFTAGLHVGAEVKFTTAVQVTTGAVNASDVGYVYPATGAVAQTVQERLEQYVSVKDFGAVGDGVTNDFAAIQAAVDTGKAVFFPKSTYVCQGALAFDNDNQSILLQGSHLIVDTITFDAQNVVLDLGGGIIDQNCRYAKVAVVPPPQATTITVDDASRLIPGQTFVSSWGDNISQFPLGGPTDPNPHTISQIVGNVVTLNRPMNGTTMTLTLDLNVGNFSYGTIFSLVSGSAIVLNGVVKNAVGYYGVTPNSGAADANVLFQQVNFESNGTDQFFLKNGQTWKFSYCTFAQNLDVAKSGFYFAGDAYLYLDNCSGKLGNYDMPFIAGDFGTTYTGGEIVLTNCRFSGETELNPAAGYFAVNCLHVIEFEFNGNFDRVVVENCEFSHYQRQFISTTVLAKSRAIALGLLSVKNSSIACPFAYFLMTGAGNFFVCPNARVSNTSFYVDSSQNGFAFSYADGISGATTAFQPHFDGCYFKLAYDSAQIFTESTISHSTFDQTPLKISYNTAHYDNCWLKNGSSISVSPGFSTEFYGSFGTFIVDDTDFPLALGNLFSMQGGSNLSGAYFGSVKSANGSMWYDIFKVGTTIYASGEAKIANSTYFLRGDDYFIPTGSRILDMYAGTTSRVTFDYLPALTATAAAGATSIVVSDTTGIAIGDRVNIVLDSGLVDTRQVAPSWGGVGLTVPLTSGLSSQASSGNQTCFFRVV